MSNDADTRVVAASVYSSGLQSIAASTYVKVQFDTKSHDTHGAYSTGDYQYVVPVPGVYRIASFILWEESFTSTDMHLVLYKNGSLLKILDRYGNNAGGDLQNALKGSIEAQLVAGDIISIYVRHNHASAKNISDTSCYMDISRISGPSAIAASESVAARYTTVAGQSIPNGGSDTVVVFGTKTWDTHSAFNAATGIFTAPVSGKYSVKSQLLYASAAFTAGTLIQLSIIKNSTAQTRGIVGIQANGTFYIPGQVADEVSLLAGETVKIGTTHGEGAARTLHTDVVHNYVSIVRVGNY